MKFSVLNHCLFHSFVTGCLQNKFSITYFLSLTGRQFWKFSDSNMFSVSVSYFDYIITCPLWIVSKKKGNFSQDEKLPFMSWLQREPFIHVFVSHMSAFTKSISLFCISTLDEFNMKIYSDLVGQFCHFMKSNFLMRWELFFSIKLCVLKSCKWKFLTDSLL